jgi:hypothetical protein
MLLQLIGIVWSLPPLVTRLLPCLQMARPTQALAIPTSASEARTSPCLGWQVPRPQSLTAKALPPAEPLHSRLPTARVLKSQVSRQPSCAGYGRQCHSFHLIRALAAVTHWPVTSCSRHACCVACRRLHPHKRHCHPWRLRDCRRQLPHFLQLPLYQLRLPRPLSARQRRRSVCDGLLCRAPLSGLPLLRQLCQFRRRHPCG